jgi:hypothetical protein
MPGLFPIGNIISNIWNLKAASEVLKSDQNADGKLNKEEYQASALVQGDGYFSELARDYEFAVVDEIKVADGQVTMGELSEFYRSMDSDKNAQHSKEEFAGRLNQSSWSTRFWHPIASFSNAMSHYTNLVSKSISE